ncbi:replication initiator protein [Dipodfec virus UOA04_Rod_819]|nr:replication initiator protein [Dipodfec virus UOA04_Rod_819]
MCTNMVEAYLCKYPSRLMENAFICTRQYREKIQFDKEYILFSSGMKKYGNYFTEHKRVYVPCGKCIQCLMKRSKSWECRATLENLISKESCCLTLTYDDENLPKMEEQFIKISDTETIRVPEHMRGKIYYKDIQDFIKRLRKHYNFKKEIRYFCGCEYGSNGTLRPHFHIILYGFTPPDISTKNIRRSRKGTILYKSPMLEKIWKKGFVDVGKVSVQSCRYISQYCCKSELNCRKVLNPLVKKILQYKKDNYRECIHSSQGLGLSYFKKGYLSICDSGFIRLARYSYAIPNYFIKKLEEISLDLFTKLKEKSREYWLNYVFDDKEKERNVKASRLLLEKLNIFHPCENLI